MSKLRPYQQRALEDIFNTWHTHDVIFLCMATGTGKTKTFTEVIKGLLSRKNRGMLICNRQELILQAWQTFYQSGIYSGIIMAGYKPQYDLRNQVCSVQTIIRRTNLPPCNYIVIDEGQFAQEDNSFGKILNQYPDAKVLVVSATPTRLDGTGFLNLVTGKETQLIINHDLKSATEEGWLVPLKYYVSSIPDLTGIKLRGGDYDEEESEKAMEMAPVVESYLEHCQGMSGIVFAVNVHHSQSIVRKYLQAGISAAHIDANTPSSERARILNDFRAGIIKVVSNVGIISYGFDVPDLQFVQLCRPTKSLSMFLQMVGRGTRALPGIVDLYDTPEERKRAIAESAKPHAIILDNAGCWLEHGLPDADHDWERHFRGEFKKRRKSEEEEMEMLVFVAEDESGVRHRFYKAKEMEGMRLIEVTTEMRKKVIDLVSLKEFDKLYAQGKRMAQIKKVWYFALMNYLKYCKKHRILITGEMWETLEHKLVTVHADQIKDLEEKKKNPMAYGLTEILINEAIEVVRKKIMPSGYFRKIRDEYIAENMNQILAHAHTRPQSWENFV